MMVLAPMLLLGTSSAALGPCDIFAAGHTPCVAAHSVVRALYSAYNGPLYAVRRRSDNRTLDVRTLGAGGVADSAAVDAYCGAASNGCTIAIIYDQSPQGNHLQAAPGRRGHTDIEVNATHDPLTLGGKKVYSAYFQRTSDYPNATGCVSNCAHPKEIGVGYRNDNTTGVAKGDEPETLYMVASGQHYNEGCCFDVRNSPPSMFRGSFPSESRALTADYLFCSTATRRVSSATQGMEPWRPSALLTTRAVRCTAATMVQGLGHGSLATLSRACSSETIPGQLHRSGTQITRRIPS